jgi:hypothetical protein
MTTVLDPQIGAELLAQLGFLLVPGPPAEHGSAYLFVALRRQPTLRHFDPQRVDYWVSIDGRGTRASLDCTTHMPLQVDFSWGLVSVVDRLAVANDYLSFGGELRASRSEGVTVAVFSSEAPILARGGHSQGWDPGAERVAGFFASLRAAAARQADLEAELAQMPPVARYAAFVADWMSRYRSSETLRAWTPNTLVLMRREAGRLRRERAAEWTTGADLAARLGLAPAAYARRDISG